MNYIPGFSNHLETSVPRYAVGGEVMSGLNLSDADLAALASLNSASASGGLFNQGNYGSDFGSLDNVYGVNFGSDFGSGGSGGGLYKVNPYLQTFQAPLSDKGNPTAYAGGGIEVKSPTQTFRLLDKNTGKVVYEGVGYEGVQEAIARAGALTAEGGAKAQWEIQTPNSQQESGYSVVANEKRSQSTLGDIASVALPIGMALLTGGMSLPAQMAAAGIAGAAGAGLAGKNPAKAGLISAATAGLMGGTGANEAIGKAVGGIGGALTAKTAEEVAKTAAEKAAEQIIVTGLSKVAQGAGSAIGNTLLSEGVKSGLSSVTGYKTPAEKFAEQPLPDTFQPPVDPYAGLDPIVVSGTRVPPVVPNYGGALSGVFEPIATDFLPKGGLPEALSSEPTAPEPVDELPEDIVVTAPKVVTPDIPFSAVLPTLPDLIPPLSDPALMQPDELPEDIVVTAPKVVTPDIPFSAVLPTLPALIPPLSDPALMQPDELPEDIVVNAPQTVTPDIPFSAVLPTIPALIPPPSNPPTEVPKDGNKLDLEDYLRLLALVTGAAGGGGGSGSPGTYTPGGRGLNPIFSAQLPAAGGLGTIGANRTTRPLGDVDWLTYGERPELKFFDYSTPATRAPITSPIPDEPAGPSMYAPDVDDMRFARGGAFAAKRGGSSDRTEFAVNGPGTGRSDDIPAVLSDGEYVIDAETVALLGDGSSKAGAKKLDDLRVKIRKHKGKKLAKGRFSANAKKPEAYLSGGRI